MFFFRKTSHSAGKILCFLLLCSLLCSCSSKPVPWTQIKESKKSAFQKELATTKIDPMQSCYYGGENEIIYENPDNIIQFLSEQPDCNLITVFIAWSLFEPEEGVFDYTSYQRVFDELKEAGYHFIVVLDAEGRRMVRNNELIGTSIPSWIWEKFPEDRAYDFYQNPSYGFDFYSTDHIPYVLNFYETALDWLDENYRDSIYAITPGIQAENEIKFAQNQFHWQCYTPKAEEAFHLYLTEKYGTIEQLNERFGCSYLSYSDITMPIIDYNNSIIGNTGEESFLYTELMDFREKAVIEYVTNFTDLIHEHQYKTLAYFGQFMFPIDAIYATGLARHCTDIFDYAVIDYNFYDGYKEQYNTLIPAYLTNLMDNIGYEKTITGLYFERVSLDDKAEFVKELNDNILKDGHSHGIEIGSLVAQDGHRYDASFQSPNIHNKKRSKLAIYNSEWNYYKTHGEAEEYQNYLIDSTLELYSILQNKLGMPVEIITDVNVLRGDLKNFDLVFFPAQIYIPDEEISLIKDYLAHGGKAIQDFRFAEYDEYGNLADRTSVFGIELQEGRGDSTSLLEAERQEESLTVEPLYEQISSFYYYVPAADSIKLFTDQTVLTETPELNLCTSFRHGNTLTWGFQPQLQYQKTGDEAYVDFIRKSILYMER